MTDAKPTPLRIKHKRRYNAYNLARKRLGMTKAYNSMFMRISAQSSLKWVHHDMWTCVRIAWERTIARNEANPLEHKGRALIEEFAAAFGLHMSDINGKTHDHVVSIPRQLIFASLRVRGHSYCYIAKCTNRDHTSVLKAMKKYGEIIKAVLDEAGIGYGRPTLDRQPTRLVSAGVHGEPAGSDPAAQPSGIPDIGRPDGSQGQAFGEAS